MALSYFYDGQFRRFLEQFMRVFSGFQVHIGKDRYGKDRYYRVPVVQGDTNRMVQHIKRLNTENTLIPTPFVSCYIQNIEMAPSRRQNPQFESTVTVQERKFSDVTHSYTNEPGIHYQVERHMGVPYNLKLAADIWTSNIEHKVQLLEQMLVLFNPDINIQTSDNPVDWTAINVLTLEGVNWSGRSIPPGIDDQIDIATLDFDINAWINPPAKVRRQRRIYQVNTEIFSGEQEDSFDSLVESYNLGFYGVFDNQSDKELVIVKPNGHYVEVDGQELTLLGRNQDNINPDTNEPWRWDNLLAQYGDVRENISRITLRPTNDIEDNSMDFVGRIKFHPNDPNKLLWIADLETVPPNSLESIDAIIDPQDALPGYKLPNAQKDQRYLLTDQIGNVSIWNNVDAGPNDIIEYNGSSWVLSFDSSNENQIQYTMNDYTGQKLKWNPESNEWIVIPDGVWSPGYWFITL